MLTGSPYLAFKGALDSEHGFSYLGLLLFIAITGIGLSAAGMTWQYQIQSEKEKQLLFVGNALRVALKSYYDSSPSDNKSYPAKLDDLLLDKRVPNVKRHLRQLYTDPVTGSSVWGLVKQQGRIVGIYSLSNIKPLKHSGFAAVDESFAGARTYRDWVFGQQVGDATSVPLLKSGSGN